MTKTDAVSSTYRQVFYHVTERNADGTACRARVNGRCKTWKTRLGEFKLPVKYGLYGHFYITEHNAHEWLLTDPTEEG